MEMVKLVSLSQKILIFFRPWCTFETNEYQKSRTFTPSKMVLFQRAWWKSSQTISFQQISKDFKHPWYNAVCKDQIKAFCSVHSVQLWRSNIYLVFSPLARVQEDVILRRGEAGGGALVIFRLEKVVFDTRTDLCVAINKEFKENIKCCWAQNIKLLFATS